jgi:hypothetical protein
MPETEEGHKLNKTNKNNQNITDLNELIEVKLGCGHPNKTLKRFIENDRKVINFDIVWFDDKEEKRLLYEFLFGK